MGKIVLLMGKSTTGKDTIYKELLERNTLDLKKVVIYTTRPMRDNEQNGVQYYFCDEEGYQKFLNDRKIIEGRTYDTCYGPWRYFTVDDGQIDLDEGSSLMIGTIEAYESMVEYFGQDKVVPVYIEISDRLRMERAMHRENKQEHPKYDEMCRRFLADEEDFSEDKIKAAGIKRRFNNEGAIDQVLDDITEYLKAEGV